MKKSYLICVLALILGFVQFSWAQENMPKYRRSSLHMILLSTDDPKLIVDSNATYQTDFDKQLDEAWQKYPFPDNLANTCVDSASNFFFYFFNLLL